VAYESFAKVYDRLMVDMPYAEWLDYLEQSIQRRVQEPKSIRSLVDLGCGTGSLSIPLARKGYQVTGVDYAPEMLAIAEQKRLTDASQRPLNNLQFLELDMCDLQLSEPADVMFSFCDSMNYVTDEVRFRQLLQNVYQHLRPNGLFVFDVHMETTFEQYDEEQPFVLDDADIAYIWTCDYQAPLIEHHLSIFTQIDGEHFQRIEEWHQQRYWSPQSLQQMLIEAGFAQIELCADFTFLPVDATTRRLFVIASKPAHLS
jgi:SAM-dependent methyltransferase